MSTATHANTGIEAETGTRFAPYAQLVKMLVPSSASLAVYDIDGDLIWCSDGYERPDLREIVDELRAEASSAAGCQPGIRTTTTGITAFGAVLSDDGGHAIGCAIVELAAVDQGGSHAVAPSLLKPVLECIRARLVLERAAGPEQPSNDEEVELLLTLDGDEAGEPAALQRLVEHCVRHLECVGGAFVVPEKNFSVVVGIDSVEDEPFLDRTQRHLLAWVQLNNRPMVVNRVGSDRNRAPYKILSCPVRDPERRVTGLLALFRPASGENFEIRDVRILEYMSRRAVGIMNSQHDPLTGLVNRTIFERRAQQVLDGPRPKEHVLLYIDVDRLQLVNDAFGYQAGDEVIQRMSEVIRSQLASDDLATRIGGDRFAVLMPEKPASRGEQVAEHLLGAMARLGYINGSEAVPISVSIGLATPPDGPNDIRHLLAASELACKRAKQLGGNRVDICSDSSSLTLARRDEVFASASLQQALQNNEFRLEAQPIVAFGPERGRILGYEVLVRMRDASGQLVAPDRFVRAAERYGLMPALDKWVVSATLRALKSSSATLEDLPLGICINLSAQTLQSRGFAESVVEELKQSGLPAESFCFEFNESAAVNHLAEAQHFIDTFALAGCHAALDDFGHALTSLAHLKRLKVRYLKIDGSLVRRLLDDLHVESLVSGLAKAAQTLGIKTVAEHVESERIAAKLESLEVDHGQGYFFGHPQPLLRALGDAGASQIMRTLRTGLS